MTQTSREKRIYVQQVYNDQVQFAEWSIHPLNGLPPVPPLLEQQADMGAQTQVMVSGLYPRFLYELRPVITGTSGQVYEPDSPYIIRCER